MTVTDVIPSLDISKISKVSASISTSQNHHSFTERLNLPPTEESKIVPKASYMPSIPLKKSSNNNERHRKRFLRVQNNVQQTMVREEGEDERWLLQEQEEQ